MQRAMKGNKRITDDTGLEQISLQPDHAAVVNQVGRSSRSSKPFVGRSQEQHFVHKTTQL